MSSQAATSALQPAPPSVYATAYGYDASDELRSLTDPAGKSFSFFYDQRGGLRATLYPNGTFSWNDYLPSGWLLDTLNRHGSWSTFPSSAPADGSPLVDYSYQYFQDGQKSSETRIGVAAQPETTSYSYDSVNRLDSVVFASGAARRYCYDQDSNRTQVFDVAGGAVPACGSVSPSAVYTYDPQTSAGVDELSSVQVAGQPSEAFAYDSDGDTTGRGQDTLSWDGRGRLSGGSFGGVSVVYGFDATGFRRGRSSNGTVTHYLLGGLFQTDGAGSVLETDIAGPAGDLVHYQGPPTSSSTASFVYYDGHGDAVATADATGTRTGASGYDPFGGLLSGTTTGPTPKAWLGAASKRLDTVSGLVEMGARPYDPTLGRFLSVDPVDGGSLNNYDYVGQDPINGYDPDGTYVIIAPPYGGAKLIVNALQAAANWLCFWCPKKSSLELDVDKRTEEKIATKHQLSRSDVVNAINNASGGNRAFNYVNMQGIARIGFYDAKSRILVVATKPVEGVAKVVTAFKASAEYVARQKAR